MTAFDFKSKLILIIGAGSIGERHIRNLWQLGFRNLLVYRQRNLPFKNIGEAEVEVVTQWELVKQQRPFAAIICTPTAQHLSQVYDCAQLKMHVLCEKPLSHTVFDLDNLKSVFVENNVLLMVGYMLHYHPLLKQVKDVIDQKTYGNVLSIQTYWGEYLPHWHPWEDYSESYAAMKEQGGGAALTLSHDLDVVNWLMGASPLQHRSIFNYASNLKVDTDSGCDTILKYASGATAHVHVNFHQKVAQRWYKIVLDNAVIDIDYYASTITIATEENVERETLRLR